MAMTLLLWTQLVGAWALALLGPPIGWLVAFLVICACVSGMQLWVHESSHYTLFRSRRLNDAWAGIFFASPIGMSVRAYRRFHMTHHAHLGMPEDKDRFAFNVDLNGPRRMGLMLLRCLLCVEGVRIVVRKYLAPDSGGGGPRDPSLLLTAFWNLLLLASCVAAGRWYLYLLLWAYPILGVAVAINLVRSVAEHQPTEFRGVAGPAEDVAATIRSTKPGVLEKWLVFQANFNHHFEHHLYPGVTGANLPRVQALLIANGFYERHPELIQVSAFGRVLSGSCAMPRKREA